MILNGYIIVQCTHCTWYVMSLSKWVTLLLLPSRFIAFFVKTSTIMIQSSSNMKLTCAYPKVILLINTEHKNARVSDNTNKNLLWGGINHTVQPMQCSCFKYFWIINIIYIVPFIPKESPSDLYQKRCL